MLRQLRKMGKVRALAAASCRVVSDFVGRSPCAHLALIGLWAVMNVRGQGDGACTWIARDCQGKEGRAKNNRQSNFRWLASGAINVGV